MAFFPPFVTSCSRTQSESYFPMDTNPSTATSFTYVYSRPEMGSNSSLISFSQQQRIAEIVARDSLQPKGLSGNDPGKLIIKRRTQFTSWQRKELETIFSQSQYISPKIRQSLSQKLGTSQEVILTWFKNRRARWRKENRGSSSNPAVSLFDRGAQHVCCFGNAPREFQLLNSSPNVPHPNSSVMSSDVGMLQAVTRRALGTDVMEHQSQTYPGSYAD